MNWVLQNPAPVIKNTTRALFEYNDDDEIYLSSGCYWHDGTIKRMVHWNSKLTYQFSSLAADDWSYLYLDDSAIVTADTNLLTASELTDSTTEPTWSASKGGWYNGNDLCIFAVLGDGSGDILEFVHANDFVTYTTSQVELSNYDLDASWENVTLTAPSYCTKINTLIRIEEDGVTSVHYRPNGSSGSGIELGLVNASSTREAVIVDVVTDNSQIIEVKFSQGGSNEIHIKTNGWFFPIGM